MFLRKCDLFVDEVYKIMSEYSCFDKSLIKSFAYMHCAAYISHFMSTFGKKIPNRYIRYFFKKSDAYQCMNYSMIYKDLYENPFNIDFQWIPKNCPFDVVEYIQSIDGNPVNISELIFISFCFNPNQINNLESTNDSIKRMDDDLADECITFLMNGMGPLLDLFDELNTLLKRKYLKIVW